MADLRNAVLATLAYYDVFDFPLTLIEVHHYLVNPARLEKNGEGVADISLLDVRTTLDALIGEQRAFERNGYYMLSRERSSIYEGRIAREKTSSHKWKKLLRIAWWFQAVPFLRAVFASGSLAIENADRQSDFDALVIVRFGRMYTCRMLLSLVASLFGARRKRYDRNAPDKFCFNHYLTDDHLRIEHESLFNAQTYVNLRPVLDRGGIYGEFYRENPWLNKFVYNFSPSLAYVRRCIKPSRTLTAVARAGEFILDSGIGDIVEGFFRWYQQRRIRGNAVTYAPGGRTIFSDTELEFHPHSAEREILDRYNATVREMGTFWNYSELDSGLQ